MYKVQRGSFSGQETIELSNESTGLKATVLPGFGSNLIALDDLKRGIAYIKTPATFKELENRPTGFGTPVLMPPGRIKGGKFTFQGQEYQFEKNEAGGENHIHGLVLKRPWQVATLEANQERAILETVFESKAFPELEAALPQNFTLTLTFVLEGRSLRIQTKAENHDPRPMPFWLGFHPYFQVPLGKESTKADCEIQVATETMWELEGLVPTGKRTVVTEAYDLAAGRSLEGLLLDNVYSVRQTDGHSVARYHDKKAKAGIEYLAGESFKHWVIYTGKDLSADFVCLEPYTAVPNAANLDLSFEETGLIALEAGKPYIEEMEIKTY